MPCLLYLLWRVGVVRHTNVRERGRSVLVTCWWPQLLMQAIHTGLDRPSQPLSCKKTNSGVVMKEW